MENQTTCTTSLVCCPWSTINLAGVARAQALTRTISHQKETPHFCQLVAWSYHTKPYHTILLWRNGIVWYGTIPMVPLVMLFVLCPTVLYRPNASNAATSSYHVNITRHDHHQESVSRSSQFWYWHDDAKWGYAFPIGSSTCLSLLQ